jgi:hypothetical protein
MWRPGRAPGASTTTSSSSSSSDSDASSSSRSSDSSSSSRHESLAEQFAAVGYARRIAGAAAATTTTTTTPADVRAALREVRLVLELVHAPRDNKDTPAAHKYTVRRRDSRRHRELKALARAVEEEVPLAIAAAAATPSAGAEAAELARVAQRLLPKQRARAAAATARRRALHRQQQKQQGAAEGAGATDDEDDDEEREDKGGGQLPLDVLSLIVARVVSPLELARFPAVCSAWKVAADRDDEALWGRFLPGPAPPGRSAADLPPPGRRRFGELARRFPSLVRDMTARRALARPDDPRWQDGPIKAGARLVWTSPGELQRLPLDGVVAAAGASSGRGDRSSSSSRRQHRRRAPQLGLPMPLLAEEAAMWLTTPSRRACWSAVLMAESGRRGAAAVMAAGDGEGEGDSDDDDDDRAAGIFRLPSG